MCFKTTCALGFLRAKGVPKIIFFIILIYLIGIIGIYYKLLALTLLKHLGRK